MRLKILSSIARAWSATKCSCGFSLVEIILAAAIFVLLVTALIGNIIYAQESPSLAGARARAVLLAEEGLEASRNLRDANFANLANGNHGLAVVANQWSFSGSQDVTDSFFTRQVQVSAIDANRKQVVSQVTWQQNLQRQGTVTLSTYLDNWLAIVVGNWSLPVQQSIYDAAGNQDGLKVFVSGNYAYLVRNGGTPNFLVIDISNLAAPTLAGSLTLTGTPMDIWVVGNYAYVANTSDTQELQVINVSNPAAPSQVFSFDAASTNDADAIFVSGNFLYLARVAGAGPELVIISLTSPAVPTLAGSYDGGAVDTFFDVFVDANNAFVVSDSNTQEIRVVDVSTPSAPTFVTSVDLPGNSNAISAAGFSGRLAVGRVSGDFVLLNVSNPSLPSTISTLTTAGAINDLSVGNNNNYVWVASGSGTSEFQVINIINQAAPASLSTLNLAGTLNGIFYDINRDRAFGASADNSGEFVIIAPS